MKHPKPISLAEVKQAYKKYKSYVYYDNSEMFQRAKLASYEIERGSSTYDYTIYLEDKLGELCNKINGGIDVPNLTKVFGEIDYRLLPKAFLDDTEINKSNCTRSPLFVTNEQVKEEYKIHQVIVMADVSVEWQLIAVLWLMRYGCKLDALLENSCKANRLYLNKDTNEIISGQHLYKPYFKQYQQWRDDAIQTAQQSLAKDADVAVVNLDVKDYFYSTALDFTKIEKVIDPGGELGLEKCNLHLAFKDLHRKYTEILKQLQYPTNYSRLVNQEVVLPIGLASSYVLANYYLIDFDKQVQQLVPHVYYGRYVDDILLVVENPNFDFNENSTCKAVAFNWEEYLKAKLLKVDAEKDLTIVDKFIIQRFHPILELKPKPKEDQSTEFLYKLTCTTYCYIQPAKTMLYYFNKDESTAVIDKLKHDLEVRASEFRDFPEDDADMTSFDNNAYHLIYDDSDGKISTLKDYKENRLGLSIFLAHRIFASLRKTTVANKEEGKRVLRLFRGESNLKYFRFWEKILTYFLVTDDKRRFLSFVKHTKQQIDKIEGDYSEDVIKALKEYLLIAVDLVLALYPDFIDDSSIAQLISRDKHSNKTKAFQDTFLVRHHYTIYPLIVFTENLPKNLTTNNINDLTANKTTITESIYVDSIRIPRKIKFWETCIYQVNSYFSSYAIEGKPKTTFSGRKALEQAFKLYENLNISEDNKSFSNFLYKLNPTNDNNKVNEIKIGSSKINKQDHSPIVAIANTKVCERDIETSIKGEPNLSLARYTALSKMLKQARLANSKLLVLPECSVPVALIPSLARYSAQNQIAIVTGVEHWNINDVVYNFIVSILPVQIGYEKDAVVLYRLKNHYSPAEELMITGLGYKVPKPEKDTYDLINWNNIYFTSFYCFELANVGHRSLFRSKIDLMVISEWNPDTTYFANIVGATTRDLHCYVAQVNTSQYGDSRLTQPTMSAKKDLIKIKGGQNSTVLADAIQITKLRNFQLKSYALASQDKNKIFKPLPPGWSREDVEKRIKGEFVT